MTWDWRDDEVVPIIDTPALGVRSQPHRPIWWRRRLGRTPTRPVTRSTSGTRPTGQHVVALEGNTGRRARPRLQRRRIASRDRQPGRHRADLGPASGDQQLTLARALRIGYLGRVQPRRLTARLRRRARASCASGRSISTSSSIRRARGDAHPHRRGVPAVPASASLRLILRPQGHPGSAATVGGMTQYVALLRGVNVGGITVKSADLADMARGLGLDDVRTVLASGNLTFSSSGQGRDAQVQDRGRAAREVRL